MICPHPFLQWSLGGLLFLPGVSESFPTVHVDHKTLCPLLRLSFFRLLGGHGESHLPCGVLLWML